jgi:signal peptidase II
MNDDGRASIIRTALLGVLLCGGLIAADLLTKLAASKLGSREVVLIPGVLSLSYIENHGAAFGIMQGRQWLLIVISAVIIAAAVVFCIRRIRDTRYRYLRVLTVFLVAGALGNMIDRIMLGYVRDFIYFKLIDFPVFNVADIYVTVSAVLILIWIILHGDPEPGSSSDGE